MHLKKLILLGVVSGAALTTQAQIHVSVGVGVPMGPGIVIREAPPRPNVEAIPPQPGPDFFWVEGHWFRDRDRWVWRRGHWDRRPRPGVVWVPGHWDQRPEGWVWIDGRWDNMAPPPPAPPAEVVVQDGPPAPFVEVVPMSPGPDFFWVGGHWGWHDRHWVWTRGRFERRPRHEAVWAAGHYDHRPEGWVWVEGRWR